VDCLYFLADADHNVTVQVAENHGFHLVDIRLTLGLRTRGNLDKPRDADKRIRPCQPADEEALKSIARSVHLDSRFFADPHFPPERCAALYETWIAQDCGGSADLVLVAEWAGQVAGYISCQARAGKGQISLLGVKSEARGRGVGQSLVAEALHWFAGRGAAEVSVVTQARNLAAQQVYQKAGFRTWAVQLWYHRWFTAAPPQTGSGSSKTRTQFPFAETPVSAA
jgi:ribosomal protein S18 acetylase RimI-like enzyme